MAYSGMLRCVALVRTDVSKELSASFITVTKICELGTTLAVTSNRRRLRRKFPESDNFFKMNNSVLNILVSEVGSVHVVISELVI
jgi:hypothetical protein